MSLRITALTRVGNYGWEGYGFLLDGMDTRPACVSLTAKMPSRTGIWSGAARISGAGERQWLLETEPFSYRDDFVLRVDGLDVTKDDVETVRTDWVDRFRCCAENGIWYRLYEPETPGPHPLVLYLHGGGESGTDNQAQLVNNLGAAKIAERYPEACVMAPQTPVDPRKKTDEASGKPPYAASKMYGWTREYLGKVCQVIRRLIAQGSVDSNRVLVTGMARGGGGALLAMDVDPTLFAAAAPVCPRMTPEVFEAFRRMAGRKIWVSIPYADDTLYRNKYIVDAILELKDAGSPGVHLTIYSPEELARYGLGTDQTKPLEQRLNENHHAWILAYNNEYGVLDWLLSQNKTPEDG